jgi:hypothetical protein
MKAKFTTDLMGRVTVVYADFLGREITRTFTCPENGGWVREGSNQVCQCLSARGETLTASSRAALLAVIRSEYRRMRRVEKAVRNS